MSEKSLTDFLYSDSLSTAEEDNIIQKARLIKAHREQEAEKLRKEKKEQKRIESVKRYKQLLIDDYKKLTYRHNGVYAYSQPTICTVEGVVEREYVTYGSGFSETGHNVWYIKELQPYFEKCEDQRLLVTAMILPPEGYNESENKTNG